MEPISRTIYSSLSNDQLAELVHSGDVSAFRELYDRHWEPLYRHALKMVGNSPEAEDLVQETMVFYWEQGQSEPILLVENYLYRALRFRILKYFERTKVRVDHFESLQRFFRQLDLGPDAVFEEKEGESLLAREVSRLPKYMQTLLNLRKDEEMSYKEISATLNISENTVKKELSLARKLLKTRLAAYLKSFLF